MGTFELWNFEDLLDERGIFTNGISGERCSRESYFTVVDFDKLEEFLKENIDSYSQIEWSEIHSHFIANSYLSPINRLVACAIYRYVLTREK